MERHTPCTSILLAVERHLHTHNAGGGNRYLLHVHVHPASDGKAYTLHVHTAGGRKAYTLHAHTAGCGNGYMDTSCMSILLLMEEETPCMSILFAVERDEPCTSILLVVEMDTPCTSILGLATESRSEKIRRNKLGTAFVITRTKVLIPRFTEETIPKLGTEGNGRKFYKKSCSANRIENWLHVFLRDKPIVPSIPSVAE